MEENVYEISVGQIFRIALKHWWVILIALVLGAAIALVYVSFFVTPSYTTYAKVGIKTENMSDYQSTLVANSIAQEGSDIIVSNITLQRAADYLNADKNASKYRVYTPDNLLSMLKTSIPSESRFFDVEIRSTDPNEAKIVCDAVVKAFCDVLVENDVMDGAEGKIIHNPVVPKAPSSPNKTLTVILGMLIGFVLSFGAILVAYFIKDALDGEDWLIDSYKDKIPMLSVIPDSESSGKGYRKYYSNTATDISHKRNWYYRYCGQEI